MVSMLRKVFQPPGMRMNCYRKLNFFLKTAVEAPSAFVRTFYSILIVQYSQSWTTENGYTVWGCFPRSLASVLVTAFLNRSDRGYDFQHSAWWSEAKNILYEKQTRSDKEAVSLSYARSYYIRSFRAATTKYCYHWRESLFSSNPYKHALKISEWVDKEVIGQLVRVYYRMRGFEKKNINFEGVVQVFTDKLQQNWKQ